MTRKLKLLILSLLGFSAACSGVRNSSKSQPDEQPDTIAVARPDIRLMYGVRRPVPVAKIDTLEAPAQDKARRQRKADSVQTREMQVEEQYPVVTMYGVRVPMQNIDLDSLKRAEQERRQNAEQNKE